MLGFNWIDCIIIVLLALAVLEGVRIGFVTQLAALTGFFVTLFAAGWLYPHLLPVHDKTIKTALNASLVLLTAVYVAIRAADFGRNVHWSFRIGKRIGDRKLRALEMILGSVPALIGALGLVWLLGVAIGRLPFQGFSNSVSDSAIVQRLTDTLPPVPAVFAEFDRTVDPNSQPAVPLQAKPYASFNYSATDVQTAESKAAASVVRITSFSCGGVVSGSGFAVGQGLVATNAHVIAGSKRPIIKYNDESYAAVPVYFDPDLDLAFLRVQGLTAKPLVLNLSNAALGSTVALLGFPGGNYRVLPGIVRDTLAVSTASIYDQGSFGRGVYVVQATVSYGSSGGPVVLASGQVAGIIFSKSLDTSDTAYALTSPHIVTALDKAKTSSRRISTGACMVQ